MDDIELTAKQKQQWGDTVSLMAWTAPGFRHLWYKLLANNNGDYTAIMADATHCPNAQTDGKNIMVNPDWFFGLSLSERVYVLGHEIIHNVYGDVELLHRCMKSGQVPQHDGTHIPFDNATMQKSMDYRINALLNESNIGKAPKEGNYDPETSANESVLDVYKRNYVKQEDPDGDQQGPGGFDGLLPPGSSTGQNPQAAAAERNPQQWATEIATAQTIEQIRSQGKISGALKRMFKEILEPEIPWTEHIRGIFNRRVGSGSYNYRRPDRRFIVRDLYVPSRSGNGAGHIVIWGDTSGSIGPHELEKYLGELSGIVDDCKPRRLTVIWCDSAIQHVDEVQEAMDLQKIKQRGVGGGGGTSVDPVFQWIEDNCHEMPDAFIGFTDGCVTFPDVAPAYPVIWASVDRSTNYPFGEVVQINTKVKP